jgi:hypothetical protein
MFPEPVIDVDNEPFWAGVAEGELRYQHCRPCDRFWYPPGPVCPRCQRDDYEWRPVGDRGVVGCAVRYHKRYFPDAPVPYVVAQVDFPCGVRLSANVVNADGLVADVPPPGTPVEVVYHKEGGHPVPAVRVVG